MDKVERDKLQSSIDKAKETLAKGLILPEAASQLRRMIYYYQDKIDEYDANHKNRK